MALRIGRVQTRQFAARLQLGTKIAPHRGRAQIQFRPVERRETILVGARLL